MRIRQSWLVVAMLLTLLFPAVASADGHRAGLFGGGSVRSGSVLFGVHAALDAHLPKGVAIGGDFSWYSDDSDSTIIGVAVRYRPGFSIEAQSLRNYFFGVHALAVAVRQDGKTSEGYGAGFSNDFVIKRPAKGSPIFLRAQLDVIDAQETFVRFSVGLLKHW